MRATRYARLRSARWLGVSDPTRRDLELSLGAFAEAMLIAAAGEGIALRFEGDRFVPAETPYDTPFTGTDLEHRRTSRLAYAPGRIEDLAAARGQFRDGEALHELSRATRWSCSRAPTVTSTRRRRSSRSCVRGCGSIHAILATPKTGSTPSAWISPVSRRGRCTSAASARAPVRSPGARPPPRRASSARPLDTRARGLAR